MSKERKIKPDDPEQSKRFIETAEELGADDSEVLKSFMEKAPRKKRDEKTAKGQ
jgi:hypothetical protein